MNTRMRFLAVAGAVILAATFVQAQVVREADAASVAGILDGTDGSLYLDFEFMSPGREVLFASLDAGIYQTRGRSHPDHDGSTAASGTSSGGTTQGGGCGGGEGGSGGLCLQVVDAAGEVLCYADRPNYPGWQRDPRMMCPLPDGSKKTLYALRISLSDGDCGDTVYPPLPVDDPPPFLLSVSLRRLAPEGSLSYALGMSKNRFKVKKGGSPGPL